MADENTTSTSTTRRAQSLALQAERDVRPLDQAMWHAYLADLDLLEAYSLALAQWRSSLNFWRRLLYMFRLITPPEFQLPPDRKSETAHADAPRRLPLREFIIARTRTHDDPHSLLDSLAEALRRTATEYVPLSEFADMSSTDESGSVRGFLLCELGWELEYAGGPIVTVAIPSDECPAGSQLCVRNMDATILVICDGDAVAGMVLFTFDSGVLAGLLATGGVLALVRA